MPGWAKALLITGMVIIVLVVAVIGVGVYWWSRNKDALISKGKEQIEQGQQFGRGTDNQGCVDQAIVRYKKQKDFANAVGSNLFLSACLRTSRPTPDFCVQVPKQTEFIKSAQWRREQCFVRELETDTYCQQLFSSVQQFCERPAAGSVK